MTDLIIETGTIPDDDIGPQDIPPDFTVVDDTDSPDNPDNWHDPDYPYSTPTYPYGFFPDKDGKPDFTRPRKRRPHKRGTRSVSTSRASDKDARIAAGILTRFNALIGVGLAWWLPVTAQELGKANIEFEEMAYQALLNDPELCRQIMAAGTTSGRAQLAMAYVMLGGALAPMAYAEVRSKRAAETVEGERVA